MQNGTELSNVIRETRRFFIGCANAFDKTADYPLADRALAKLFRDNPGNTEPESVILKVAALNALYRTQILDTYGLANHVLSRRIDLQLKKGSPKAVDLIRLGHGIRTKKRRERDLYSFSTKYCHWHRPDAYPMYDYYVGVALRWLNERLHFRPRLPWDGFQAYSLFVSTVDKCRVALQLEWSGYKRFDQGLWILGQVIDEVADRDVLRFVGHLPE